jgi:hypothetical protein
MLQRDNLSEGTKRVHQPRLTWASDLPFRGSRSGTESITFSLWHRELSAKSSQIPQFEPAYYAHSIPVLTEAFCLVPSYHFFR